MFGIGKDIKARPRVRVIFLALVVFLLTLLIPGWTRPNGARSQAAFSEKEIRNLARNFEYTLVDGSKYRLKNGLYESGEGLDNYVSLKLADLAVGDLNNDGEPEAAVILVSNFGGSGSFYELTVLVNRGQNLEQTNSLELGDRVDIKKLAVSRGKIRIDLLTHGPDDPMCCPSQKTTLIYGLTEGRLQLLDKVK